MKIVGLTETKKQAENAYPKSGGHIEGKVYASSDIEATGWVGGKELWERKPDGGWVRAYSPQNKPTAEDIQGEPRFNTTIDLTSLSSDRYYPVWWRFPSNYSGANSWLTIHRNYSEDRDKKPFGEGVTHLAGLQLQIEGSEVAWGGDAQYLNIKRIRQTYRNTVKNICYGMMSIARPIDGKYPLYNKLKSGDITNSPVISGCYLRGGLTYHVTHNFSDIYYSREEGEVEAHSSIQPYNNFEIKWMVKSYAIDDHQLGKDYNDTMLPYSHDYAETINQAKNSYPKTGGQIEGKVYASNDIEATGWVGGKELWERNPDGGWVRAYTPQNKPTAADVGAYSKNEADDKYLPRYSKLDTQVGLLSINNGSNWPGLVYVAENGHRIGIEGSQGKILTIWANDPADNRLYNLQTPQKSGTLATLDDIVATKNTSNKEPNGWWKCGDTGLIIQWGKWNNPYETNDLGAHNGIPHGTNFTQNFAIPFSNACFNIMPNITNSDTRDVIYSPTITIHSFDKNKFIFQTNEHWGVVQNSSIYWLAIGY